MHIEEEEFGVTDRVPAIAGVVLALALLFSSVAIAQVGVEIDTFIQAGDPLPDEPGEVFDFFDLRGAPPTISPNGSNIVVQTGGNGPLGTRLFVYQEGALGFTSRLTVPEAEFLGPFNIVTPDPLPNWPLSK